MFYIAMVQTDMPPDGAALGIDYQSNPYAEMSYWRVPVIGEWEFSWHQNFMIRAYVDTEVGLFEIGSDPILLNAYPNPFTTTTTIEFTLDEKSKIQISIYNTFGQPVYQFEDHLEQGSHKVTWSPGHLPGGMYYAVLRNEDGVSVVKIVKE